MAELSPMMEQYLSIKKQHPNEILFYRVGDFYEMFFEDALTASKELELTLTGKQCGMEERAPMCGVPFHSYETYVARLIAKGYKVAICEQTELPSQAKGLVRRDIIRVVTPGTVIESSMLQDDRNNYIASIYCQKKKSAICAGVCFADISTGDIRTTVLQGEKLSAQIITELCRFEPSEVLFNEAILGMKEVTDYIKKHMSCSVELLPVSDYDPKTCSKTMEQQFGPQWESVCRLSSDDPAATALAALLGYLSRTQKHGMERLKSVQNYAEQQYMQLSPVTRSNLELTETMRGREKKGTLLWSLDKTGTAMGKRLLRSWLEQPLVDPVSINQRLDAVECLYKDTAARADIMDALSRVFDMERLITRTVYGSASPREVYALACTCRELPALRSMAEAQTAPLLKMIAGKMDELADIREMIFSAVDEASPATLKDGGVIKAGYSAEVDELRKIMHGSKGFLSEMETQLRQETGIPKLKIGFNRVFGYYIEISKSYTGQAPAGFVRKQTLTNGERYITPELKELENKILGAGERLNVLEHQLFAELLKKISDQVVRVQTTARAVAQLDVLVSLAQAAVDNNYSKPIVDDGDEIRITDGRHPVVEQVINGTLFVPNDTLLDCGDNRMLIITGPNMAGKSTYMRQNAIITLMAQIGSFVPAKECHVGVVDAIFTRVGASDDLSAGQSTFMVEMTEVADILERATSKSLVILDEIGRGTSTFDGMSIARAVVEHISCREKGLGCKTMFATHYHELTELENLLDGVKNYNIAVKKRGEDITFLRRIVRGPADDSYGIEVAKLAGLPSEVTKRARAVLKGLEANAPDSHSVMQMDFALVEQNQPDSLPSELVEKLRETDVNTLTPLEALNFLFELKKTLV